MTRRASLLLTVLTGLAGVLAACDTPQDSSQTPGRTSTQAARDPVSDLPWLSRSDLPREANTVLNRIAQGGPFRYAKDGASFGNRKGLLPQQARNHYREYTVPTPGENDRGARRIVCGGQPPTRIAECYYTADHYVTFRRIRP